VVVVVRDAGGQDVHGVLSVDGVVVPGEAATRAIPLNPGPHTVRFEPLQGARQSGFEPVEQTAVLREGEKQRSVTVTVSVTKKAEESHVPVPTLVFGGIGAASLVSFAVFGALGVSKYSDLSSSCKPRCSFSDADATHTRFLIADISLAVTVLSLGAAAYFYFSNRSQSASRARAPSPFGVHF
jgi:hypothetical protein